MNDWRAVLIGPDGRTELLPEGPLGTEIRSFYDLDWVAKPVHADPVGKCLWYYTDRGWK